MFLTFLGLFGIIRGSAMLLFRKLGVRLFLGSLDSDAVIPKQSEWTRP